MKKDRMFQYAYDNGFHGSGCSFSDIKIVEDTGLITEKEALVLWDKYYDECLRRLKFDERPQMCIWKDCETNTDYHTVGKEVDYRDCELEDGHFYRVEKKLIP